MTENAKVTRGYEEEVIEAWMKGCGDLSKKQLILQWEKKFSLISNGLGVKYLFQT